LAGNVTGKALVVGGNTIVITVTAEDGATIKTYTITIIRAASNDATLKSLTTSNGELQPAFDANITEYTVHVANDVTTITITGETNHEGAMLAGNITGKTLVVGGNTIAITVTAEDGATTKTYTVTIIRAASDDATLKSLIIDNGELQPAFAANITEYTVHVANDVTTITMIGEINHEGAILAGNVTGKELVVGENTITIIVTAENGATTKTYTVTVFRADSDDVTLSDDATLKSLTTSRGVLSPAFSATVMEYEISVAIDVTTITITGEANHEGAMLAGNVTDETLVVGRNSVSITVTAEDGVSTKTYTVTVIRALQEGTGMVAGKVANAPAGTTVDLYVRLKTGVSAGYIWVATVQIDANGNYKFDKLPEGVYILEVTINGYSTTPSAPVTLPNGGTAGNINFTVKGNTITPDDITGNEELLASGLKAYPNPFTGEVRIIFADETQNFAYLRVINAVGVVVHTQIFVGPDETLRLEFLHSGMYFLTIDNGKQQITKRIVKN